MRHVVFITGNYFPNYSANGICIKHIIDVLKQENKISVIAFRQNIDQPFIDDNDSVNVYNIYNLINELKIKSEAYSLFCGFKHLNIIIKNAVRLFLYLKAIMTLPVLRKDVVRSYLSVLERVSSIEKIDLIIPVCFPFESIVAAVKFKEKNHQSSVVPYLFDSYPESITLNRLRLLSRVKRQYHYKVLFQFLNETDYVLAMNSFEGKLKLTTPYKLIEHPLLNDFKLPKDSSSVKNKISMIYAGSFNKNVRNPWIILDYLKRLSVIDKPLVVYFFIKGDYTKELSSVKQIGNLELQVEKVIPFNDILYKLNSSDFLLNISDESGIQISGKIFTYISLGKPIINFHQVENDNTKKILDKYPLGISINKHTPVEDLEKFIVENKNKQISHDQVKEIFPDAIPDYTVRLIKEIMDGAH